MDTAAAEQITETNHEDEYSANKPKVLIDECRNIDENYANTNSLAEVNSDTDPLSLNILPDSSKRRLTNTESIHSWFMGKVTGIYWDDGYFVAELRDIDKGNTNIAEFDIESAFDGRDEADLKLFVGAIFAFYVFTKHGMGSPLTSTGLEFNVPYIWQEDDNEKVKKIYDEMFPEEFSSISP